MKCQTQYLEINSSARNRNDYPLPSQFECPLSQSGRKLACDSLDPVSLSAPKLQWTGYQFNKIQAGSNPSELLIMVDEVTIAASGTTTIGNASSMTTLLVNTSTAGSSNPGALQTIENYYVGTVAGVGNGSAVTTDRRRIISYKYLGNDRAQIILESSFSGTITAGTTLLYIVDPSDVDSVSFTDPHLFIPASEALANGFVNHRLYNQTRNQSRPVKNFDETTHLLYVDTSGSTLATSTQGPVTTWVETDTFSIRESDPGQFISGLNGDIVNTSTTHRSFNLTTGDADNIADSNNLPGAFLEVQMDRDNATRTFRALGTLTTTVQLAAASHGDNDHYIGSSVRVLNNTAQGQIAKISGYDGTTKIATLSPGFSVAITVGGLYNIVCPQLANRIVKYVDYRTTAIGGSTTTLNFPITTTGTHPIYTDNYYNELYINVPARGGIRRISTYIVTRNLSTCTVESAIITIDPAEPPFTGVVVNGDAFTITSGLTNQFLHSISTQPAYILPFSYDNLAPFNNVHKQIAQSYEIELLNLILPNQILDSGFGSMLSYYQYVYVEIKNYNNGACSTNIISNNPNSSGMTFRATIDDNSTLTSSRFIKIDGDGMTQMIQFDPNDNLKFSVYLETGSNPNKKELFKVLPAENFSPNPPNSLIQISAMFSLKHCKKR